MTSMGGTAVRTRAAYPLAVLGVLLGLLAMHGLASAHHAAASSARLVTQDVPDPAAHHHGSAVALSAAARDVVLAAPARPACDQDCPAVVVLCLAVLTGAALALLLAGRRSRALPLPPARRTAGALPRPARHARGPDPVRELCISRT